VVQLLYFEPGWRVWRSVNFLGHFLMFSIMLISVVNPPRRPKKAANHGKAGEASHAKNGDRAHAKQGDHTHVRHVGHDHAKHDGAEHVKHEDRTDAKHGEVKAA
jgi:hypothetical protein